MNGADIPTEQSMKLMTANIHEYDGTSDKLFGLRSSVRFNTTLREQTTGCKMFTDVSTNAGLISSLRSMDTVIYFRILSREK